LSTSSLFINPRTPQVIFETVFNVRQDDLIDSIEKGAGLATHVHLYVADATSKMHLG
jgi:hypothetical protein